VIDKLARGGNAKAFQFTKPKQDHPLDFSFSGIKTASLHYYRNEPEKFKSKKVLRDFCASFQEAVVRWTVAMLRRDFFSEDPTRIITIWLLGSAQSYRDWALALFGDVPTTPYGYYSAEDDALIMNIRTGGGTLVHEIVHPFVEANLPDCPAWVDEGLGSLFEQTGERDGQMVGLINWRLPGLQRAIEGNAVPAVSWLAAASDATFYGRGSGVHYAEARYLMYYLQEAGSLHRFVAEVGAHRDDDPSAYETLSRVLDEPDMVAFQQHWERWVSYLRPH